MNREKIFTQVERTGTIVSGIGDPKRTKGKSSQGSSVSDSVCTHVPQRPLTRVVTLPTTYSVFNPIQHQCSGTELGFPRDFDSTGESQQGPGRLGIRLVSNLHRRDPSSYRKSSTERRGLVTGLSWLSVRGGR